MRNLGEGVKELVKWRSQICIVIAVWSYPISTGTCFRNFPSACMLQCPVNRRQ